MPPTGSDPMPLAGLAAFAMLAAGGLLLTLRRSRR
ncbi:LPXTG cell wall anchor domain-containing protein [Kitasatospora sp. NPDC058243]